MTNYLCDFQAVALIPGCSGTPEGLNVYSLRSPINLPTPFEGAELVLSGVARVGLPLLRTAQFREAGLGPINISLLAES